MHHVTFYHFKIYIIKWNNVCTLKRTETQLDMLRCFVFVFGATAPSGPGSLHSRDFLYHTKWRTTVDRTSLDESSTCRRDRLGFEPKISAGERPQTCALDRAATGTCRYVT